MASQKLGLVVLGEKQTVFVLEEGTSNVYTFSPQAVKGNLDQVDDQARSYPARMVGAVVNFTLDSSGNIDSVDLTGSFNHAAVTAKTMCKDCTSGVFTMAASNCVCGNIKNSAYAQCEVCALKKSECAACNNAITQF